MVRPSQCHRTPDLPSSSSPCMPPSRTATEPAKRKKPRKGRNDRMHGERQSGSIISHPTRPGNRRAPGGPHHGCPLGSPSPSPSPPRREPRPGEVGLAGWGVGDQSCAPPSHRAHAFAGGRGYSARQAAFWWRPPRRARSTSTCPLLPCCTDHCGFGRKRKGVTLGPDRRPHKFIVGKVHSGHRVLRTFVRACKQ